MAESSLLGAKLKGPITNRTESRLLASIGCLKVEQGKTCKSSGQSGGGTSTCCRSIYVASLAYVHLGFISCALVILIVDFF